MYRVSFLPRHLARNLRPQHKAVLISIHDDTEPPLDAHSSWVDVLHLRFHDADASCDGMELFTPDQARQALEFVRKHADTCDELVVHCQAGQSRSAGMALYLAEVLGVPCFKVNLPVSVATYPLFNRRVFSTLMTEAETEPSRSFLNWAESRRR